MTDLLKLKKKRGELNQTRWTRWYIGKVLKLVTWILANGHFMWNEIIWLWINTYENTIFRGMNIHKSQLFWCELQGYKVLTHCHMNSMRKKYTVIPCYTQVLRQPMWALNLRTIGGLTFRRFKCNRRICGKINNVYIYNIYIYIYIHINIFIYIYIISSIKEWNLCPQMTTLHLSLNMVIGMLTP